MDKIYLEKSCKNCKYFIIRNVQRYEQVLTIYGYCSNFKIIQKTQTAFNEVCNLWQKNEEQ